MPIELISQDSRAARRDGLNEDRPGAAGALAWVIDGATDLHDSPLVGAASDASWLAATADRLLTGLGKEDFPDLPALVTELIDQLAACFAAEARRAAAERWEFPSATLLLAGRQDDRLDWLSLGDCALVAEAATGIVSVNVATDDVGDRVAAAVLGRLAEERGGPVSEADRRAHMLPQLRAYRSAHLNRKDGYGVLSIVAPDDSLIARGSIPMRPGGHALLATDGLMRLVEIFARHDAASLVAAAKDRGIPSLIDDLRALETADADGLAYPRLKTSDDATGVLIRCR